MDLLEVALLPGKGRGYRATDNIAMGTVVHISDPYATTVSQEWIPETCMWCFDFSYPKKQKVKIVNEEEQASLLKEWNSDNQKQTKHKQKSKFLFKDVLFCSDKCKDQFKKDVPYWKNVLAMNYRLDLAISNHNPVESMPNTPPHTPHPSTVKQWVHINDDAALSQWLSDAWDCLTESLDLFKEIDDTDKSMLRLIAACILRKNAEENVSADELQFKDVLVIQNNELTHFRTRFSSNSIYPDHPQELPTWTQLNNCEKKQVLKSLIPNEVIDVMALYSLFARALTTTIKNTTIPVLPNVSHALFRSIFFREKANSFGLWEMSSSGENGRNDGVSDDRELLGWGIYPSAVYFNHSCDANAVKIRNGRKMTFIARRMIEKSEEVCISYGNVGEGLDARRSRLLEHYHFLCQCTRCLHENNTRTVAR